MLQVAVDDKGSDAHRQQKERQREESIGHGSQAARVVSGSGDIVAAAATDKESSYSFPQVLKHKTWMIPPTKTKKVMAANTNKGAAYGASDRM